MFNRIVSMLTLSVFSASVCAASVYKCTDGNGRVMFSQVPCAGAAVEMLSSGEPEHEPAPAKEVVPKVTHPVTTEQEEQAKQTIAKRLKDPQSLMVRNLVAVEFDKNPENLSVCGEYNSKNSFGGYSGFSGFAYMNGVVFLEESSVEAVMVSAVCR